MSALLAFCIVMVLVVMGAVTVGRDELRDWLIFVAALGFVAALTLWAVSR